MVGLRLPGFCKGLSARPPDLRVFSSQPAAWIRSVAAQNRSPLKAALAAGKRAKCLLSRPLCVVGEPTSAERASVGWRPVERLGLGRCQSGFSEGFDARKRFLGAFFNGLLEKR